MRTNLFSQNTAFYPASEVNVAAQLVLAACSPFFRRILADNPHEHPLLYLRGVRHSDILGVLAFIYNGNCNIAQVKES